MLAPDLFDFKELPTCVVPFFFDTLRRYMYTFFHLFMLNILDLNSFSKDIVADNLIIRHGALLLLNFEVINIGYIWINSHCIGLTHHGLLPRYMFIIML